MTSRTCCHYKPRCRGGKQIHDANIVATMLAHGVTATLSLNLRTQALVCASVVRRMRAQEPGAAVLPGHARLEHLDG